MPDAFLATTAQHTVGESDRVHLGQRDGATIWIGHDHESPPGNVLGRPKHWHSYLRRRLFRRVWVFCVEAHRSCPGRNSRGKDSSFVVTSIVAMQNDLSCWS